MPVPSPTIPVLQPGSGLPIGTVYLPSAPENVLWGRLPRGGDQAALRILPGSDIVIDTLSHEGLLPDQGSDPLAYFGGHGVTPSAVLTDAVDVVRTLSRDAATDGPHVVTGPIAVAGARPGDLLAVTIRKLELRVPYGVVSTRHGKGVLTGSGLEGDYGAFCAVEEGPDGELQGVIDLGPDGAGGPLARFALHPFLGILGVGADSAERPNSVPPGLYGGNIDVKEFTEGTTVFFPVQVDEALLYAGDPHFAQGDGEVALTALEASLRATLTVDVVPAATWRGVLAGVEGPFGLAHGRLIATGLDLDLDEALRKAVHNAVRLLVGLVGADERRAYLYLSAAADFDISQAVDIVKGVHGAIRLSDFGGRMDAALAALGLAAGSRRSGSATGAYREPEVDE